LARAPATGFPRFTIGFDVAAVAEATGAMLERPRISAMDSV
jgi:hypothetical protein